MSAWSLWDILDEHMVVILLFTGGSSGLLLLMKEYGHQAPGSRFDLSFRVHHGNMAQIHNKDMFSKVKEAE